MLICRNNSILSFTILFKIEPHVYTRVTCFLFDWCFSFFFGTRLYSFALELLSRGYNIYICPVIYIFNCTIWQNIIRGSTQFMGMDQLLALLISCLLYWPQQRKRNGNAFASLDKVVQRFTNAFNNLFRKSVSFCFSCASCSDFNLGVVQLLSKNYLPRHIRCLDKCMEY
jgi:hypothetical protein